MSTIERWIDKRVLTRWGVVGREASCVDLVQDFVLLPLVSYQRRQQAANLDSDI